MKKDVLATWFLYKLSKKKQSFLRNLHCIPLCNSQVLKTVFPFIGRIYWSIELCWKYVETMFNLCLVFKQFLCLINFLLLLFVWYGKYNVMIGQKALTASLYRPVSHVIKENLVNKNGFKQCSAMVDCSSECKKIWLASLSHFI